MDIANKVKLGANGVTNRDVTQLDPRAKAKYTPEEIKQAKKEASTYAYVHGLNSKDPRDLHTIREFIWETLAENRESKKPEVIAERKRLKEEGEAKMKAFRALNPAQQKAHMSALHTKHFKESQEREQREGKKINPNEGEIKRIEGDIEGLNEEIEARREYYDFDQKKDYIERNGNAEGFRPNRELSETLVKYYMEDRFKKIEELYEELEKLK